MRQTHRGFAQGLAALGVVGHDFAHRFPKARAVVHLAQVRQLMHHHIIDLADGQVDEPPVQANVAVVARTAPARAGARQTELLPTHPQQRCKVVQALFEQQQIKLAEKDFKITALTHELAYYKRIRFGKASEALVGEQRMLFEETVDMDLAAIEQEVESAAPGKRQRKRAGRQPLPTHLERIEHRHEPESCQCGQCGADLVKIGEDISEQLDVEPARFFVHRHIRPQYACRPCETVTAAPIPPAVIDGGLAAVGLLAWIAACKYLDHLPLYRQNEIYARAGVDISRSTLADWVGACGVALASFGLSTCPLFDWE